MNAQSLELCALASHRFWYRAGGWVEQERSEYLLALTYNALGRFEQAEAAASRALNIIEANGEERVDRAFIHVEAARAARKLGKQEASENSLEIANRLASEFNEDGLREWFDQCSKRMDD